MSLCIAVCLGSHQSLIYKRGVTPAWYNLKSYHPDLKVISWKVKVNVYLSVSRSYCNFVLDIDLRPLTCNFEFFKGTWFILCSIIINITVPGTSVLEKKSNSESISGETFVVSFPRDQKLKILLQYVLSLFFVSTCSNMRLYTGT